jgi:hypothetical protein
MNPVSVFTVLCAGVFICCWTFEAIADTYTVTGEVPAAPLSQGAVITSPSDGTIVTDPDIQVSGTCPSGSYIKLQTNNTFSGVTYCQNNNFFTISDDLYSGQNDLIAQDYNITNAPGPVTPTVSVIYNSPTPPNTGSSGSSSGGTATITATGSSTTVGTTESGAAIVEPPLLLTSNYSYQTTPVDSGFLWTLNLEGGFTPYTVEVDWGDGSTSTLIFKTDPQFQISHYYKKPGYYPIKVQVIDSRGVVRFIYLAARIVKPNTANSATTNSNYSLPVMSSNTQLMFFSSTKEWLWLAWPSFIIVMIMIISYWLGEREEVHKLYKRKRRHA